MNDENERVESIIDVVLEMIDDGFGLDEIADYLRESLADLPDYQ